MSPIGGGAATAWHYALRILQHRRARQLQPTTRHPRPRASRIPVPAHNDISTKAHARMDRWVCKSERSIRWATCAGATHVVACGMSRALTSDELDELLISLTNAGSRTLSCSPIDHGSSAPSSSSSSPPSSSSSPPVHRPLLISASKKRPTVAEQAEEQMECDEAGLPVAVDEDTRKARKMARNRRAAAMSRERKKQRVDELEELVAALQQENASLKRRLAFSGSETSETTSDVESWPLSQQPEAFWLTYAPLKQACTPPPFHALLPRLLASLWTLCLSTLSQMTTTTSSACSAAATTDAPARASTFPSEPRPHPIAHGRCIPCGRARHWWLRGMLRASTFVCVSA